MKYLIDTERLGLRKLIKDDCNYLQKMLGDSQTMIYYPATYSIDEVNNWINRSIKSYHKNGFGLWAVILKETNSFIGQCGISLQKIDGKTVPEIGYHINKKHWNHGYATEAAKASLNYGFQYLNLEKIFIHTYINNIPSQRIAKKIGMKKVKEYNKQIKSHNVIWRHVVFEKSKKETTCA